MKRVLTRKVVIATLLLASLLLCGSLMDVLVGLYTAQPELTPTPLPSPTPGPGQFALGVYVQITGTSGVGLNMRSDAGLKSPVLFLGYDTEVYQITKGPKQADGDTWWYLTAPYDQTRSGWAAQNYLSVLPSP